MTLPAGSPSRPAWAGASGARPAGAAFVYVRT